MRISARGCSATSVQIECAFQDEEKFFQDLLKVILQKVM